MKKMEAVSINQNKDGDILISQPDVYADSGEVTIILTKDQLPLVISWLQEIAK